ncbi:hypothetical protein [Microbispora sp. NBRC 16548]|uniref:hypothetical protein n=1 Tax=Microbispora sp. NBRC 16548 TaxID=3030994 RepID=UPI00160D13DA|nr:hypothetical protein [Microbispora sp. NBRC 16548]GLX06669.1 hypothetical protein Misp03_35960 [Microbispora sp. NBRC 16548]
MPYVYPADPITPDELFDALQDAVDDLAPLINQYKATDDPAARTELAAKIAEEIAEAVGGTGLCVVITGPGDQPVTGPDGEPLHFGGGYDANDQAKQLTEGTGVPHVAQWRTTSCRVAACGGCGRTAAAHRDTQEEADQAAPATWARTPRGLRCDTCTPTAMKGQTR